MLFREVVDALFPGGSLWYPEIDANLDRLLDGYANNKEAARAAMATLADLRNALLTPILDGLEEEYGLATSLLSETARRDRLAAAMTAGNGAGTAEFMQTQLRKAGFDVYVHVNSPAVDPAIFLFTGGGAIMGHEDAIAGRTDAFCGTSGESLVVVNGDADDIDYAVPATAGYWPTLFFVGGAGTRDSSGYLTAMAVADIAIDRKNEFISTIVKLKPAWTWAGLAVDYVLGD